MGSIQYIYNPEKWEIVLEGKSKILANDYIYQMAIGYCDDELSSGDICEFISKENYENILNGIYFVKKFPYSSQKIIILDKDNNIIPLVKGKSDGEQTEKQKAYMKRLQK